MLTGNGVALILRVPGTEHGDWWSTRGWWAFASIAGFSLLSKYVVRWKGRHIFNPSNLGLVVGVVAFRLLPVDRMNDLQVDLQDLWWGPMSIGLVATLAVIGVGFAVITRRLGLLGMALAFWGAFAAGTAIFAASGHCILARWHIGPLCDGELWRVLAFSPEVLIFLAFMITDPKTTPSGRVQRIVFGGMVGVFAALMLAPQDTELRVKLAILASLIVGCAVRPLVERLIAANGSTRAGRARWLDQPWRYLILGAALAFCSAVLLLTLANLSSVESPRDVERPQSSANLPEPMSADDLPMVVIDSSTERLSPPMDQALADELAADVLNDLAVERRALRYGDADLASYAASGARLKHLQAVIASGARAELATYEFDKLTIQMIRLTPQSPPWLSVQAEGSRQLGGVSEPIVETFRVELGGDGFLIDSPSPTLIYE
ncbi:MAG: hypothetical protein V9F00_00110 [Nocardioides sp.]